MKQTNILLCIGLSLAVARLRWVWLVRHDGRLRMEDATQARRGAELPDSQRTMASVGITQFYARSGEVTAGDPNLICYGVRNATSVRIEPPVENLAPAVNRCFFVEPQQDTTYITVGRRRGRRPGITESFRVSVRPAPAAILMFTTSERQIPRGEAVTLCYGVAHATESGWNPAAGRFRWPRRMHTLHPSYEVLTLVRNGGWIGRRFR